MSELFQQVKLALEERYQLEFELGSGGMATVYLALDLLHERRVAIKVLHPRFAGALGHDRFLQEIRFAAELTHPYILPLLDSGTVTIDDRSLPYYAMPFVEGESLRDRLKRQKQLPIEDALAIARDVASALSYAHAHDVIHRDIKPENILLAGSEAMVADFGIARAVNRAADATVITTYNMAVGTPQYMSPEQSLAAQEIDGRSDIYSLGCVLYEMLGGEPPFTGSTPQAIVARHQLDPVPSLTTIRPTVPLALELAVRKALQKQPADRFRDATQFTAALAADTLPGTTVDTRKRRARHRPWIGLGMLGVVATGVLFAIARVGQPSEDDTAALDTTLYAIVSTREGELGPAYVDAALLLRDALNQWTGVRVVDAFQVGMQLSRIGSQEGRQDVGQEAARSLGAGRYVRVDMRRAGNVYRVQAVLYDTEHNEQLSDPAERLDSDYSNSDSVFASLAERLLFRDDQPRASREPVVGTLSVPARQAFARGQEALEDWNLAAADSAFDAASRYDPQFVQGLLWLALIRWWSGQSVTQWSSAAERAAAGRDRLSARERKIVDAVLAQSREDDGQACRIWGRMAAEDPYDFVAWYGWGDCLRRDDSVIRSTRSPTGWRFRSSYHQALKAYRRAFQLLPSIHRSFRAESFASVRRLFEPSANDLRSGRAVLPDTTTFLAPLSWQGDSLLLIPIPSWKVAQGHSTVTSTTRAAVRHQRESFHEVASGWVAAFPRSAEALENLALSLDVLGDRSALDTLRLARGLARGPVESLRVAVAEVWMNLKFSILSNPSGVREAKLLADSLLKTHSAATSSDPGLLAGLAALTGRAHQAASLSAAPAAMLQWQVPRGLAGSAPELMVYAAMGGPLDSLVIIERRLLHDIAKNLDPSAAAEARAQWLAFPATLAFPAHQFASLESLAATGDRLLDAQVAFLHGDSSVAIRALREMRSERQGVPPADLTIDALYLEAWLWASLGYSQVAADWLDPTLNALPETSSRLLAEVFHAGPLVRAMALRARLANALGDQSTARRWARVVTTLWSTADEFLRPELSAVLPLSR